MPDHCPLPLAILPGLMCNEGMFVDQLAAFPTAQVIDGFYHGADRIKAMADHVLARLPERFALLGHSMGGRVALEVYRKAPARVACLALLDTGVHPPQVGEANSRYGLRDLGRQEGFAALVDAWLPPMLGRAAKHDAALVARLRAMCLSAGQSVFEAQTEALLHRPDAAIVLGTITCPTLVAVGEEDGWSTPDQHRTIAEAVPGAQLEVLAGAGHMMPAEAPEALNAVLTRWLNAVGILQEA